MFSLATTAFYMLSAYIAFLIGSSEELNVNLIALVPVGFVAGYLLDRLNSVKKLWIENPVAIYKTVAIRYMIFLIISLAFMAAGMMFSANF